LEAAEAVGAGDGIGQHDVLDLLSKLVDKSLVVAEASQGEEGALRYRMLETLRQYGQERLEENGEAQRVRERHAEYYLALAEGADSQETERELNATRPVAWLKRMESEHANLRAALSWSLDKDDEPEGGRAAQVGLRLSVVLWWFWHTHQIEGRRYLQRALSGRSDPTMTRWRARALNAAAGLALYQADYGASKALMEDYAVRFDDLFRGRAQREGFRRYLEGLLLPAGRNKTLTALANTEPVAGAQRKEVQSLQWLLSESGWDQQEVNGRRLDLLFEDSATARKSRTRGGTERGRSERCGRSPRRPDGRTPRNRGGGRR
jgi:DDE superfamily endonuclease